MAFLGSRQKKPGPSVERLRELLHYDPGSGLFTRIKDSGRAKAGKIAGVKCCNYLQICIDGVDHYSHKLAWLYIYGEWPFEVDHINRDSFDNRIANLRPATSSQNGANSTRKAGTSGYFGVQWSKAKQRWAARYRQNSKTKHIGYFGCRVEAARARDAATRQAFGEFAILNFPGES